MIVGTRGYALIAACALFVGASFAQGKPRPLQGTLEARIAALKGGTAALVASALARLNALSPEQGLAERRPSGGQLRSWGLSAISYS